MSRFMDEEESGPSWLDCLGCLSPLMIHPSSIQHLLWDSVGLLLIGYDCIVLPLEVFEPGDSSFTIVMQWCIRIFWTANLLLSFIKGYMLEDGTVNMDPLAVARRYAMTWMTLDLIIVAFDWMEFSAQVAVGSIGQGSVHKFGSALRGLRMIRTLRLMRLLKTPQLSKEITQYIPFTEQLGLLLTIAKIMSIFLWVTHVVACLWWLVGLASSNGWIRHYSMQDRSLSERYMRCFHWSLAAFSGDTSITKPQNIGERVFATSVLFLAFVISASYVGSITTSMTRLQLITSEQSSKLAMLRRFLLDHHISRSLAVRVQRNAQHAMLEQKNLAPESNVELLKLISNPVLVEVHFEIHSRVILEHPFFLSYNEINPAGIRKVCHTAISMLSLHPKDVLFSDLEVPTNPRMFFVVSGSLLYLQDEVVQAVDRGIWISEAVLWTKWTHCGMARSKDEVRLLVIDAEHFTETVSHFPSDHAGRYAETFVDYLNGGCHTDLQPSREDVARFVQISFPDDDSDDECDVGDPWAKGGSRKQSGNAQPRVSSTFANFRDGIFTRSIRSSVSSRDY